MGPPLEFPELLKVITLDFETRSCCDLGKLGVTRYATDASTQVLCLCWTYDQDAEIHLWHRDHPWIEKSARPDELLERIASGELVEAHNAGFEYAIWNGPLHREFSEFDVPLRIEQMRCSAAKGSCMSLPRALGDAAKAIGLSEQKDADGRRLINKLCKPMPRNQGRTKAQGWVFQTQVRGDLIVEVDARLPFAGRNDRHRIIDFHRDVDPLIARYPTYSKDPAAPIRRAMQRYIEKGYFEKVDENLYYRTDRPFAKSEFKGYKPDFIPEPISDVVRWCEDELEHKRNWKYCAQDVRTERAYSNWLPEMMPRELEYWLMDFRMNQHGITLDRAGADRAIELATSETERLNKELFELTGGAVYRASRRAVFLKWANKQLAELGGAPLPDTRADTFSFALYGVPTKASDEVRAAAKPAAEEKWEDFDTPGQTLSRALVICMEVNRTSVAKYQQMINSEVNGKLHDIMLYNGADRTGRWSGKGTQPHNFVRGYKKEMCEVWDDIVELDPSLFTVVWGDEPLPLLAKACRGALVASRGKELYAADFNAIEARKIAWLAGCSSLLKLFRTNGDPYLDMAEAIYKRPLTKKDNPAERQLGKIAILGLSYGMGWEKFQLTVWLNEGLWLEDEFCQEVVRIYRKDKCPEMPRLWKAANTAAIAAVQDGGEYYAGGDETGIGAISYFVEGRFLHCRLPSGRLLAYLDPEVHTRVTWRFNAINEHDKPCVINLPSRIGVPTSRARWKAEQLAAKQRKRLTADAPENFLSPHLSFMGRNIITHQWQRCGTHGGSLTENADQASSRDTLAEAMFRVDETDDFELLLSIHDEVIAEAPIGTATVKEFEALMAADVKWAPGLPVSAEGWIGQRLRK